MHQLRTAGVRELQRIKKRVARAYSLGRISREDFDKLHEKVLDLEAELSSVDESEGITVDAATA